MRHGFGTYFYLNRDVYSGDWVEHIRHGPGKYTYASNGVIYTGNWERGRRAGSGVVSVLSREALSKVLEVCYSKEAGELVREEVSFSVFFSCSVLASHELSGIKIDLLCVMPKVRG